MEPPKELPKELPGKDEAPVRHCPRCGVPHDGGTAQDDRTLCAYCRLIVALTVERFTSNFGRH